MDGRTDIETREDCERLVRAFYGRALSDPVIGFLFTDVAKLDLEEHVPRITNFWATILLGARTYGGGAFRPHLELNMQVPLKRGHFARWLQLWRGTVNELFCGPHAELAIEHAERVAAAFVRRLDAINSPAGPGLGTELDGPAFEAIGAAASAEGRSGHAELPVVHYHRRTAQD